MVRAHVFTAAALVLAFGHRCACAQVNIAVNTTVDQPDFNLLDGVCDCDSVTPGPQCSLRAAVQNANQIGGWVIVNLGAQVYPLSFGGTDDLGVAGDLDIFAPTLTRLDLRGVSGSVIDGAGLTAGGMPDRILHITATVAGTCEINVSDLSIRNGAGVLMGAGIRQQAGRLTLTNVMISACDATDSGGGIHTSTAQSFTCNGGGLNDCDAAFNGGGMMIATPAGASVNINNITIQGCDVTNMGGNLGGGVRISAGVSAAITGCGIGPNTASSGGGISNAGALVVRNSTISGNFAASAGGGIANHPGGSLTVDRCIITSNQANSGGGLNTSAPATIIDSAFDLNIADSGAGVRNSSVPNPLRMIRCMLANNFASGSTGGGGYRGSGALEMINCTISGNSAPAGRGGGVYFDGGLGSAALNATTIAANFASLGGGGVFTDNALGVSSITFRSSVLARNMISGGVSNNFAGAFALSSAGFNLDEDGSCAFGAASDQSNILAGIGPLQSNGGPTMTHALLPGSPAVNHGSCTTIAGNLVSEDQRGYWRASPCDTGSFEANVPPPSCPQDIVVDGVVNVSDLIAVILAWGPCPPGCLPHCPADIAPAGSPPGNCVVNVSDLIAVILAWGPCP